MSTQMPAPAENPEVEGAADCRLVVFCVPDLVDDLVGRRDTPGLVRLARFGRRSDAWAAVLRRAIAEKGLT